MKFTNWMCAPASLTSISRSEYHSLVSLSRKASIFTEDISWDFCLNLLFFLPSYGLWAKWHLLISSPHKVEGRSQFNPSLLSQLYYPLRKTFFFFFPGLLCFLWFFGSLLFHFSMKFVQPLFRNFFLFENNVKKEKHFLIFPQEMLIIFVIEWCWFELDNLRITMCLVVEAVI